MGTTNYHLPARTWVRIQCEALQPGERAPHVPRATARTPLLFRVNGWTAEDSKHGDDAWVETAAGRRIRGTIVEVNPAYQHGFGRPHPALQKIGPDLRSMLNAACKRGGP